MQEQVKTVIKRSKNKSQVMKDKLAERQACKGRVKEQFKSVDLFGQSVGLTWQGEDTYKTSFGASITWIIYIIMAAYTIFRLHYLVNRMAPSIAKTTMIRHPLEDEPFRPSETGFDFAFGLGKPIDP